VVSSCFATADMILVKALGLGMALAVVIDATLVRGLLVPSTMRLLGNLNWWLPFAGVQRHPSALADYMRASKQEADVQQDMAAQTITDAGIGGKR
jgi:RND superfamily putative drug exporter